MDINFGYNRVYSVHDHHIKNQFNKNNSIVTLTFISSLLSTKLYQYNSTVYHESSVLLKKMYRVLF